MREQISPRAKAKAPHLRSEMTEAEKRLWFLLRNRRLEGVKFRHQHPVGPYILDFACLSHNLAVEIDGGQHCDSLSDKVRTAWLQSQGWRIVRFWNNEALDHTETVLEALIKAISPHPNPLPQAGEGTRSAPQSRQSLST
jgi:adenine-specific DNA-methyltransferase